ncbi:MAG: DNA alkylation repair protein [Dictyoglomaceae bacterium]|nr:DNA alkylation repair protein [Dictyoglomaceae bacterium]
MPTIRKIAKEVGKNHKLALELWKINTRETRILASMIDIPEKVKENQMEEWAKEFSYWEICDQVCQNLFSYTPIAYRKAILENFFPLIIKASTDERNFVKKGVSWALRQIGKRNTNLNMKAIEVAREIQKINSKSAKWISSDVIKELTRDSIQERIKRKSQKD